MPARTLRRRLATLVAAALVTPLTVVAVGLATASPAAASGCPGRHAQDIDDDGHADLVVGSPLWSSGTIEDNGDFNLVRGSSTGLTTVGNQRIDETTISTVDTPQDSDYFGVVHAVGFFNSDCYADVVVGVPGDDGNGTGSGSIVVIYGSATGLVPSTAQKFSYTSFDAHAVSLGRSITSGDFNGDGYDDVAVGAPDGDIIGNNQHETGGVAVLYGSASGLTLTGSQWLTQGTGGVPGTRTDGNVFGLSVVAGDFNGDGKADLAVGATGDSAGSVVEAGSVTVLYGSAAGLTGTGAQRFTQDSPGVPGTAEEGDGWAFSLAAGDITGDGRADLAVGDIEESVGTVKGAGSATVLYGSASGLTGTGAQLFDEDTTGVPGTPEQDENFGYSVAIGDFNGDGHGDLAIGVPFESIGSIGGAGMAVVLYGTSSGLTTTGVQQWDQNTPGVAGTSQAGDGMGESLQTLNLVGGTTSALVIGVYAESSGGFQNNGGFNLLLGSSSGLTTTGNQWWDATSLAGGAESVAAMTWTWIP